MTALILVAVSVVLLTGADQGIKLWAIANLKGQPEQSFLPLGSFDWMHLHYLENSGAAFSMFSGSRLFLIVFSVIMISACLYCLHRYGQKHRYLYPALTLIVAGGLGNLIDRLFRGGRVVDYFDFQPVNFAVFNFADVCVTVGVVLMFIGILFLEKELPEAKKLKTAKRIPYARHAAPDTESAELPLAGELPEAGELPAAEPAEERPLLPEYAEGAASETEQAAQDA